MNNVVYYIGVPGDPYVKIGTTKSLHSRLRTLATARYDGDKLAVLAAENGSYEVERRRHEQFAGSRANGEWFRLTPELQAHIDALALRSNPEFIKGYDEGYQAALSDRGVVQLITCEICGDERATPSGHIDDEDRYDICGPCEVGTQMGVETTDVCYALVRAYGHNKAAEVAAVLPGNVYLGIITRMHESVEQRK